MSDSYVTIGQHKTSQTIILDGIEGEGRVYRNFLKSKFKSHESAMKIHSDWRKQADIENDCLVTYDNYSENDQIIQIKRNYVVGISLSELICKSGPLSKNLYLTIGLKIANALRYLHSYGGVMMKLSCENIIITRNNEIRIVDWGFEAITEEIEEGTIQSCLFSGPQTVLSSSGLSQELDVFHFGFVLYTMGAGSLPWRICNMTRIVQQISTNSIIFPEFFDEDLHNLIRKMFQVNPLQRPTASEIMQTLQMYLTRPERPIAQESRGKPLNLSMSLRNICPINKLIQGNDSPRIKRSDSTDSSGNEGIKTCPIRNRTGKMLKRETLVSSSLRFPPLYGEFKN